MYLTTRAKPERIMPVCCMYRALALGLGSEPPLRCFQFCFACMTTSLTSCSTINTETMHSRLEAHPLLIFAATLCFSEPIAAAARMHHMPSAYSSSRSGGRLEAAQAVSTRSQTWRILIQLQVYGAVPFASALKKSVCRRLSTIRPCDHGPARTHPVATSQHYRPLAD
jgi:hypothetical protein